MADTVKMAVEIEVQSPIHLSAGTGDVVIDAEAAHDDFGMPYFSARRFKGILYESALEVVEMSEQCGSDFADRATLDKLFHKTGISSLQMIIDDLHVVPVDEYEAFTHEWRYLQENYSEIINPQAVLEEFSSIRFQTSMEKGLAKNGSLHNMRVIDAGIKFYGSITIEGAGEKEINLLALAIRNLKSAGLKRNRGFGKIECHIKLENGKDDKKIAESALKGAK